MHFQSHHTTAVPRCVLLHSRLLSMSVTPQPLGSQEQGRRKRGSSIGDVRWRTLSFSEPTRIILTAVDASPNSSYAFQFYLDNIYKNGDLIVITHIPEPPKLPSFSFRGGMNVPSDKWKDIMHDANSQVSKIQNEYEDICINQKLRYKLRGECSKNTGLEITSIADEEDADMIIMATRGMGMLKRAVMGSVSEYVVKNANRPVVVIPMKQ